jgi:hypothetical protein
VAAHSSGEAPDEEDGEGQAPPPRSRPQAAWAPETSETLFVLMPLNSRNFFFIFAAPLMFEVLSSPLIVQARCMVQAAAHMLLWTALCPTPLHRCMRDVMFHVHQFFWEIQNECVCGAHGVCAARATMHLPFCMHPSACSSWTGLPAHRLLM